MLNIIKSKLKNTYKKKSLNSENVTILMKLIKGYFNSYNLNIESKLRKEKLRRRLRKLSTNKIFISDGEFKHTNDNVNITLYVYNRQRLNYLLKLRKRYLSLFRKVTFVRKLQLIRNVGLNILNKQQEKSKILTNVLPNYSSKVYSVQNLYYRNFIKKSLKRLKYYMYYKQLLYINKAKFENSYLQEFNIINLKYFYYNTLVRKAKIKDIKLNERSKYFFELENLFKLNNLDTTNNLLNKLIEQNKTSSKDLKKVVLNDIKFKRVSGVRLEAAGRLTRRYTASRSQHKVRYSGNLINAYSSIKGYPSAVIRGNYKPNIQYTKLNSKSRIGSFVSGV
ncbi:ribosomal protein (mitochondrion) [Aspergillus oryzae 100-8]|nr:ribosomal protein [Aspergillus oryzae 100-8]